MVHRSTIVVALAALVSLLAIGPAGAATPRRIISLSPTATESLFAIGAGAQVIAVDDQSDYPKRAPRTSLSGYTPNIEAIAGYRPDLVVLSGDANDVVSGLRRLKIRVLVQPAAKTLGEAYAELNQLGAVTGHRRQAAALVKRMKKSIAKIVKSAPKRSFSVYHELTPDFYSATSRTFIGRIYKLFGLRNIADAADSSGTGYPQLSGEYILSSNPSLIVLADTRCCGQSAATVAKRPGWGGLVAVRTGSVVEIDDSVASRWGPRIVQFVRAVGTTLRKRAR
ncbi:MAG TPA: ABC transporter substrate-binding protein [Gaiellaceae bacterium]|nr:ABC transporter substrate-binding protein [Gaiellaceae bacterium]